MTVNDSNIWCMTRNMYRGENRVVVTGENKFISLLNNY